MVGWWEGEAFLCIIPAQRGAVLYERNESVSEPTQRESLVTFQCAVSLPSDRTEAAALLSRLKDQLRLVVREALDTPRITASIEAVTMTSTGEQVAFAYRDGATPQTR